MMEELPKGWTTSRIEDLFCSFSGGTPNKSVAAYWNGPILWLSSGDIKSDRVSSSTLTISANGLRASSAKLCRAGSMVVVVRSGILKHTLPVAILDREAAINQDIKCFDSGDDDLNRWFAMALKASSQDILALNREGTTVQSVKYETLKSFELPVPPMAEQQRLLVKLDGLIANAQECQERLARVSTFLKRFRQSVLAAACSGRLTADWRKDDGSEDDLPAGWKTVQLETLLPPGGIFDGPFGSNLKTSDYTQSGIRVIRLENIGRLRFKDEKETYISKEKYQTLTRHKVSKGDIVFASFIDEEIRVCVLPEIGSTAIAKADCFCLRPKIELVQRNYLAYQLSSQKSYNALFEEVHGATRPRINTTQLRKLEIRICPLAEQDEIVRRVENLFSLADKLEARYESVKRQVDRLPQSMIAKALRGELVPTEAALAEREGRPYESAEQLLQRIQAANGQVHSVKKRKSARGTSRKTKP